MFRWRIVLRAIIPGLIAPILISIAALICAPAAMAAPVCLKAASCGLHGDGISLADPFTLLAIAIFAGLMALAVLLPDFDGSTDEDWDMGVADDLWKH